MSLPSKGQFLPEGFRSTPTSLSVDKAIGEEAFLSGCNIVCRLAKVAEESLPYWIGDMINAAEELFPNRYEQAVEISGYVVGTLRNYAWMCRHVPRENRGIMPIQHTIAVAPLPQEEQKALLERADAESLTATEFRRLLKGDPSYRRRALPDMVGSKKDRLMSEWEKVWQQKEREWLHEPTAKQMCRKAYMLGIENTVSYTK